MCICATYLGKGLKEKLIKWMIMEPLRKGGWGAGRVIFHTVLDYVCVS